MVEVLAVAGQVASVAVGNIIVGVGMHTLVSSVAFGVTVVRTVRNPKLYGTFMAPQLPFWRAIFFFFSMKRNRKVDV